TFLMASTSVIWAPGWTSTLEIALPRPPWPSRPPRPPWPPVPWEVVPWEVVPWEVMVGRPFLSAFHHVSSWVPSSIENSGDGTFGFGRPKHRGPRKSLFSGRSSGFLYAGLGFWSSTVRLTTGDLPPPAASSRIGWILTMPLSTHGNSGEYRATSSSACRLA